MKATKLLPFIVILLVLVGLIVMRDDKNEGQTIATQTKLERLVADGVTVEDIERVELFAAGQETEKVTIKRDGESWKVAGDFDAPADKEKVDDYVKALVGLQGEPRAKDVSAEALKDYQLGDDEAFRVQAFKGSDAVVDVLVGKAPDFNTVFLRKAGDDQVFVESANPRRDAGVNGPEMSESPTAKHWMDLDIMDLTDQRITKIDLKTPDKALTFVQEEIPAPAVEASEEGAEPAPAPAPKYEWKLTAGGLNSTFKQAGLDRILNRMKNMAAQNIVDPAKKAEYGLEPPAFTLALDVEGEDKPVRIHVGKPEGSDNAYLHLPDAEEDVVYDIVNYNFEQLFPKGSELFELGGIQMEKEALMEIEIQQPKGAVHLVKAGEDWAVQTPDIGQDAQGAIVTSLVNAITSWTAEDYVDVPVGDWTAERFLTVRAGDVVNKLAIGPMSPSGLGWYARVNDGTQTVLLNALDDSKLFVAPRDVVQLSLTQFDETQVKQVMASVEDTSFTAKQSEGTWEVSRYASPVAFDEDALLDLLSTVVEFQVGDILAKTPVDIGANEMIRVDVILEDDTSVSLHIDAAKEGGIHYVQVPGKGSNFTANSAAVAVVADAIRAVIPEQEEAAAESAE